MKISIVLKRFLSLSVILLVLTLAVAAGTLTGHARGIEPGIKAATPAATPSPPSGSSWKVISSPNAGLLENRLTAVAAYSQQDAWAVGSFMQLTSRGIGQNYPLIEHWNGKVWSIVPGGVPLGRQGYLVGVAEINPQDVWAIGNYDGTRKGLFIEHWNGVQWHLIGAPVAGTLNGITALSANNVWVVGQATVQNQGLVEHWDGKKWSQVATPTPVLPANSNALQAVYLNAVKGLASNDLWLVGAYFPFGEEKMIYALTEHWDGKQWTIISSPVPDFNHSYGGLLTDLTVIAPNDIWAVGSYTSIYSSFVNQVLTEHWDGTQWSIVQVPVPGSAYFGLRGVAATAPNDIWAVGRSTFEHWDGIKWRQATPGIKGELNAITHIPGTHHFWAVGNAQSDTNYAQVNTLIIQH